MTRRRGTKLSDWEIDELVRACRHSTMRVVAMRYGISEKTVRRYVRAARERDEKGNEK